MKTLILKIIILISFASCDSQNEIFNRVYELIIDKQEYQEAIYLLEEIKKDNIDDNIVLQKADCIVGISYFHLNEFNKSKEYIIRGLDYEETLNEIRNTNSLHDDFEFTKNYALRVLAQLYLKEKNYKKALEVLRLMYPNYGGDFKDKFIVVSEEFINSKFFECYYHLGEYDKAIRSLQNQLFYISNQHAPEIYPMLLNSMKNQYSKQELNSILSSVINNLRLEKRMNYGDEIIICVTDFIDMKVRVTDEQSWYHLNGDYSRFDLDHLSQDEIKRLMIEESIEYMKNSQLIADLKL